MVLKICDRYFESEKILALRINSKEVLMDCEDDFYRLTYKSESDIRDAILFQKLQNITYHDIYEAMKVLTSVCDVYINSKTQCKGCPLHKLNGCMVQTIPNNWI